MHLHSSMRTPVLALTALTAILTAADSARPAVVAVDSGSVTFDVGTNISAVSVHGKSTGVRGSVRAKKDGAQLRLDEVTVSLAVDTLATGMSLRDEHMKKYIFTTSSNQMPELRFTGGNYACPMDSATGEASCSFPGNLSIRGIEKPLSIWLKVKSSGSSYRAVGDGVVKLSDYGIERPSQFGVKCAAEVKIHIEIQGKEIAVEFSSRLPGGVN